MLHNISLKIKSGSTVAFVGKSGCRRSAKIGKSAGLQIYKNTETIERSDLREMCRSDLFMRYRICTLNIGKT